MQNWLLEIWRDFGKTILFVTHDIDEAVYLSDDVFVFSPRPGHVQAKIHVPIERPRQSEDLTTPRFMELKHHLLELLSAGQAPAEEIC